MLFRPDPGFVDLRRRRPSKFHDGNRAEQEARRLPRALARPHSKFVGHEMHGAIIAGGVSEPHWDFRAVADGKIRGLYWLYGQPIC